MEPSESTSVSTCRHAMTIDVEDYFHVSAFANTIKPDNWDNWPSRVEKNTRKLLTLFADADIKATFFVLGWVAERFPSIVKEIDDAGHEIASHGYSHQLIYNQTPETFKQETQKSKEILENIIQRPVCGYRAASYSITHKSFWALDILSELGFKWDSSIFPVHHDRYGVAGSPTDPYTIQAPCGGSLHEFPLTTAKVLGFPIPAAGGGYFRQYPYALSKWLFNHASNNGKKSLIFYLHPWEIDPDQPRVPGASKLSRFRHYTNLDRCEARLTQMLRDFSFTTVSDVLQHHDLSTIFKTGQA